jgi:hypothetical protein
MTASPDRAQLEVLSVDGAQRRAIGPNRTFATPSIAAVRLHQTGHSPRLHSREKGEPTKFGTFLLFAAGAA